MYYCLDKSLVDPVKELHGKGRLREAAELLAGFLASGRGDAFTRNLALNRLEFLERKAVLGSKPVRMIVSLTNRCICRCIMCLSNSTAAGRQWDLPDERAAEVETLLPYLQDVHWMGGEVFLSRHFVRLFDAASSNPYLRQSLATNGMLLDEEWACKFVENDVAVTVSIDGLTARTYERIRAGANMKALLKSLELLRAHRQRYRKTSPYRPPARVLMNFVVMRSNYRELEKTVEFARAYGIDQVNVSKLRNGERIDGEDIAGDAEATGYLTEVMRRLERQGEAFGIRLMNWLDLAPPAATDAGKTAAARPFPLCISPWESLFIQPGGTVTAASPCVASIGSVEGTSIGDLWNGETMQGFRANLLHDNEKGFCVAQSQCRTDFDF